MKTYSFLPVHLVIMVFAFAVVTGCAEQESEDMSMSEPQFESIFNGEDLSEWDGDPRFWSVENGAIVGETTEETPTEVNTFLIWQGGEPDNFEIRFEYRFVQVVDEMTGNSGVQIRSEQFADDENPDLQWRVRGHQGDFAISPAWASGIHYDEGGRGVLARRGMRVALAADSTETEERFAEEDTLAQFVNPGGEWNQYRYYANQDTMRAYINGELMHELIDHTADGEEEGVIALQLHTGPPMRIEFRNIELRMIE